MNAKSKHVYNFNPNKQYWLYIHVFPNNSVYIGMSKAKSPSCRWQNGNGYDNSERMVKAIEHFGWENVKHLAGTYRYNTKLEAERAESNLIATFIKEGYDVLNKQKLPIYNITRNEIYYSMIDAAAALNRPISLVCMAAKGQRKTTGGCELRVANREDLIEACHKYNVKGEFKYVD